VDESQKEQLFEMENRTNWVLLTRYVAGRCSADETREVEAWIRADPSRKQLVAQLRRIWDASEDAPAETSDFQFDMDAEWQDMQDRMRAMDAPASNRASRAPSREDRPRSRAERRSSRRTRLKWGGRAIAALLLFIGGVWLFQFHWAPPQPSDTQTAYREVVTEPGERSRIQLADGSSVMLNVDSKLRLPRAFAKKKRIVKLTGEAFFEVETNPDRPFIVKTDNASVRVHGTSFNVRGYPEEKQVQVAVTEGGVSIHSQQSQTANDQSVTLQSGEIGWLSPADSTITTQMVDVTPYIGWTEGRLVFENTPLSEVAVRLERWYNMEITTRDPALDSLRLTANLKSQSVRNVLDVISASLNIQYRIEQNTAVLLPRKSPQ
jgi:ferric-dicitrate binding protein FerR (iron transport regulator)